MTKKYEHPGYEYRHVNVTLTPYEALEDRTIPTIQDAANHWAVNGWRTVSVMPSPGPGYADTLLIERVRENPHYMQRDMKEIELFAQWNNQYGPRGSHDG